MYRLLILIALAATPAVAQVGSPIGGDLGKTPADFMGVPANGMPRYDRDDDRRTFTPTYPRSTAPARDEPRDYQDKRPFTRETRETREQRDTPTFYDGRKPDRRGF